MTPNLTPAGRGRRRQRPILTEMVPVRFPKGMIAAVKRLSAVDGVTVSTWIRRVVAAEIGRHQPPAPVTMSGFPLDVQIHDMRTSQTIASPVQIDLVACYGDGAY